MGGLTGAWLVGTALVVWNQVHASHKPPVPGTLLGVTGLFAALALIADIFPQAATVVTLAGFGLDVAGLMQVLPNGLFGQVQQAQQAEATAEGQNTSTGSQVQAT